MKFLVHSASVPGDRERTNQDSVGIRTADTALGPVVLAVLCDGMGGLSMGERASTSVTSTFLTWFDQQLPGLLQAGLTDQSLTGQWKALAEQANRTIYTYGQTAHAHLGTTLTVLLLTPTRYYLLGIGDTRAYQITWRARQLSEDQTLLAQQVPARRMTLHNISKDPRANVLLQCVGVAKEITPRVTTGKTKTPATYLLCTDGLYRTVPNDDLGRIFKPTAIATQAAMQEAVSRALAQNAAFAERDDTSMIVIRTL